MTDLAFIDTETLGLNLRRHPVWEIAVIRRAPDDSETEHLWQIRPTWWQLRRADPKALELNGYRKRIAVPHGAAAADMLARSGPAPMSLRDLQDAVHRVLCGTVLAGSNPGFDAARIARLVRGEPWHYRTIDVATLAAGALYGHASEWTERDSDGDPHWYGKVTDACCWPWKSYQVSEAIGVPRPDSGAAHTALGDTRWVRNLWDAVVEPSSRGQLLAATVQHTRRDVDGEAA